MGDKMENIKHVNLDDLKEEDIFYIKLAYQIDFNIYFNKNVSSTDQGMNERLKNKKENCLEKIDKLGKIGVVNNDRFIIVYGKSKLYGFIKYRHTIDSIHVDSIYGETKEIITRMLHEFKDNIFIDFSQAICNLEIDDIIRNFNRTVLKDDVIKNPNLIDKLTKEQLLEILNSIKGESINHVNNFSEEDSIAGGSFGEVAFQKTISNGHSILDDSTNRTRQGFVDALILSLIAGFFGGIITTLLIIFIKIKTGL